MSSKEHFRRRVGQNGQSGAYSMEEPTKEKRQDGNLGNLEQKPGDVDECWDVSRPSLSDDKTGFPHCPKRAGPSCTRYHTAAASSTTAGPRRADRPGEGSHAGPDAGRDFGLSAGQPPASPPGSSKQSVVRLSYHWNLRGRGGEARAGKARGAEAGPSYRQPRAELH